MERQNECSEHKESGFVFLELGSDSGGNQLGDLTDNKIQKWRKVGGKKQILLAFMKSHLKIISKKNEEPPCKHSLQEWTY
jgi:hypothetical protein